MQLSGVCVSVVCVYVCAHGCACPWRLSGVNGSPEAGVIGSCGQMPDMGAGK